FLLPLPPPPTSTLFPYTTLFRSPPSDRDPSFRASRGPSRGSQRGWIEGGALRADPQRPRARGPVHPRPQRALRRAPVHRPPSTRSEEHTSELQSRENLVCRLLLE